MATNNFSTIQMITREALRILHQQSNFLGTINRSYDDQFAVSGAKIGQTLNVRMPVKYTTRTNASFAAQNYVERSTPLSITNQYGVDVSFTTAEMTMSLDLISDRVLKPAMAQLAATIESECMTRAYKLVNNYTNATTNSLMTYKYFTKGDSNITRQLAPRTDRATILSVDSKNEFIDATKGLFQASTNIAEQYREGMLGRTGGFDVYENTLTPTHTTGSLAGSPVTNGTTLGTSATSNVWVSQSVLNIDGATSLTTLKAGDIITLSGVYAVHPESKVKNGLLQTFVVQEDVTLTTSATGYDVTVKPGLIYGTGNAYQNCVLSGVSNTDGLTVTRIGAASTTFGQDLQFHKDAFIFGTADLIDVSQFGAMCVREVMDGISMRWVQQYDVGADTVAGRFDILWGFAGAYPELANRHMYTQSLVTV